MISLSAMPRSKGDAKQNSGSREDALGRPREYLFTSSDASIESFRLSRLNAVANLRKELHEIFEEWVEAEVQARLAQWLLARKKPGPPRPRPPRHNRLPRSLDGPTHCSASCSTHCHPLHHSRRNARLGCPARPCSCRHCLPHDAISGARSSPQHPQSQKTFKSSSTRANEFFSHSPFGEQTVSPSPHPVPIITMQIETVRCE